MAFAAKLQDAMEARGLGQGQLAVKTGLSQGHISQMINGQRTPGVDVAARLARALNVSLDWLCDLPPRGRVANPCTIWAPLHIAA